MGQDILRRFYTILINLYISWVDCTLKTEMRILLPGESISSVYIDGIDVASKGKFVSSYTGVSLTYTNWQSGKPEYRGNEHCISMNAQSNGKWDDISCDTTIPAVCDVVRRKLL